MVITVQTKNISCLFRIIKYIYRNCIQSLFSNAAATYEFFIKLFTDHDEDCSFEYIFLKCLIQVMIMYQVVLFLTFFLAACKSNMIYYLFLLDVLTLIFYELLLITNIYTLFPIRTIINCFVFILAHVLKAYFPVTRFITKLLCLLILVSFSLI